MLMMTRWRRSAWFQSKCVDSTRGEKEKSVKKKKKETKSSERKEGLERRYEIATPLLKILEESVKYRVPLPLFILKTRTHKPLVDKKWDAERRLTVSKTGKKKERQQLWKRELFSAPVGSFRDWTSSLKRLKRGGLNRSLSETKCHPPWLRSHILNLDLGSTRTRWGCG